jgi:hypothetical protein
VHREGIKMSPTRIKKLRKGDTPPRKNSFSLMMVALAKLSLMIFENREKVHTTILMKEERQEERF